LWKNMMFFSVFQSGCGRTQHIQWVFILNSSKISPNCVNL
jgi:hypothetical protein